MNEVSTGSTTGATGSTTGATGSPTEGPVLRVLTPDTTPEEVAALVAVLSALGAPAEQSAAPRSEWGSPARKLARVLPHGPGGWRASGLPR